MEITPEQIHSKYFGKTIGYAGGPDFDFLADKYIKLTEFDLLASLENDSFVEFNEFLPYCFIHGQYMPLLEPVIIAVINKSDFANSWFLAKEVMDGTKDCYLRYKPVKLMSKMFRLFEFEVFEKGADPLDLLAGPLIRLLGEERDFEEGSGWN